MDRLSKKLSPRRAPGSDPVLQAESKGQSARSQLEQLDRALQDWRPGDAEEGSAADQGKASPTPLLRGKISLGVVGRALLALAAILVFAVKPMQRLLATTSVEATVNAQLVTIRAPIDGDVEISAHPLEIGQPFDAGEQIVTINNPRADETALNKIKRDRLQMISTIRAFEQKMLVLEARRGQVETQQVHFTEARTEQAEHKVEEIDAQIAAARADSEAAAAALARSHFLFEQKDISQAALEKAERNARVASETLRGLERRSQGADVELTALRKGIYVGDSYNDTPQSAQRGLDLELDIAELNARLEGMRAELAALDDDVVSESRRFRDISVAALRSPTRGRVWEVLTSPGETVRAGQEILRLLDCRAAIVTAGVGESAYQKLRIGQRASFLPSDGGVAIQGRSSA